MTIDLRNPTTIKALIRLALSALLLFGVVLPDGAEETVFGIYLAIDGLLTYRVGVQRET